MKQRKVSIILNPAAGKGKAIKSVSFIESKLQKQSIEFEILLTEAPNHGTILAEKLMNESHPVIVAAGGDGTCNEIINGIMKSENVPSVVFGILPLGRGNDFSFSCGIPRDLNEALDILLEGYHSPIDLGIVKGGRYLHGRFFGNGVGIGFDTIVGLEAAKMKNTHDALGYVLGALKTLIRFPLSPTVEMIYNGERETVEAVQISLMNGSRMGGFFFMAPESLINDGQLDLCIVDRSSRFKLLKTIYHYTKGTQEKLPWVRIVRTDSITLKARKENIVVHADGETICTDGIDLEINCRSSVLNLLSRQQEKE